VQLGSLLVYGVWVTKRRRSRSAPRIPGKPKAIAPPPAAEPPPPIRLAPRVERLAYTRSQAAEALGVSRSTFLRRILPHIETIEMPWGTRLIPVDELERLIAEHRRPARPHPAPAPRGRPRQLPEQIVERIQTAHNAGRSMGEIARELNDGAVPTAQGGRQWWPSTVRTVLTRAGRT